MNLAEVQQARGKIIYSFISVEALIKTIISQHYLKTIDNKFIFNILSSEQANFGFIRNALKEIVGVENNKIELENLNKLNKIRNYFAHLVIKSDKRPDDIDAKVLLIYPPSKNGSIDPQEKYDEFYKIFSGVFDWLMDISKKEGITYTKEEGQETS